MLNIITLPNEKNIYLNPTDVDPAVGKPSINNFNDHFKHKTDPKKLNLLLDKITKQQIELLYKEAADLAKADNSTDFLTCLRVTLGADSTTNSVKAIYSAVYLKYVETYYDVTPVNPIMKYTFGQESGTYSMTGNQLRAYNGNPITDYDNNINIIDDITGTPRHTSRGPNIENDTESHLFPFQEILTLIDTNQVSSIYLYNAIRTIENQPKHGLLVSPVDLLLDPPIAFTGINLTFESYGIVKVGDYANLSHLCPPSCHRDFLFVRA